MFFMMLQQRHPYPQCTSAGRATARLLLSFLALSSSSITASASDASLRQQQEAIPILPPITAEPQPPPSKNEHVFTLRHVFHHDLESPYVHKRHDVSKAASAVWLESEDGLVEETAPLIARSSPMKIHRLKDRRPSVVDPMIAAAREQGTYWASSPSAWSLDELDGPNITDRDTVITFAQMAANAYEEKPDTGNWKDVAGGFNRTDNHGFGWDSNGLRGYLYADETNSTIVIGVKGTTVAIWDGENSTTNDKENDNLFFSCCCGQQGSTFYRQVCDCATATYTCNVSCLKASLKKENRYYAAARHLYSNVTAMYPNSNVWMAGHSLGGSVSAMIGLTYGVPAITFQSVPDALPASRLGLPIPPGVDPDRPGKRDYTGAYHFGHNADPIFMGTCNGATASCSYAGYALESACHTGRECVYDTVAVNGTRVFISSHRIIWVIANVLKMWTTVPECKFTPECYDCPLWKEVEGDISSTATKPSSTSTKTRTRTTTCETPGWWGCLDETTTTSGTTTSKVTTTSTTSTCETPGWFGCNDETTTTTTSKSKTIPIATKTTRTSFPSTTCTHPGFFGGCNDPTTPAKSPTPTASECRTPGLFWGCKDERATTIPHSITSAPSMPSSTGASTTSSHSCTSSEWFGLICVDPSPTSTPKPRNPPKHKSKCRRRGWLGFCWQWDEPGEDWKEEI